MLSILQPIFDVNGTDIETTIPLDYETFFHFSRNLPLGFYVEGVITVRDRENGFFARIRDGFNIDLLNNGDEGGYQINAPFSLYRDNFTEDDQGQSFTTTDAGGLESVIIDVAK